MTDAQVEDMKERVKKQNEEQAQMGGMPGEGGAPMPPPGPEGAPPPPAGEEAAGEGEADETPPPPQ